MSIGKIAGVAGTIFGGPVGGLIGGLAGGLIDGKSSRNAAKAQENATNQASAANAAASQAAMEENKRQYDLTRSDNLPAINRGNAAGNRLQQLLGLGSNDGNGGYGDLNRQFQAKQFNEKFTPQQFGEKFNAKTFTGADLQNEPGYQFALQQGQNALNNTASARGGMYSGAQMKAESRYNNDYASTKYNDAYSRFNTDQNQDYGRFVDNRNEFNNQQNASYGRFTDSYNRFNTDQNNAYNRFNTDQGNTFNRLSGIAGTGQQAVGQVGALGSQMASNNGQLATQTAYLNGKNMIGGANARAAGTMATGNALQNALNQGISTYKNFNQSGYGNMLNDTSGYGMTGNDGVMSLGSYGLGGGR